MAEVPLYLLDSLRFQGGSAKALRTLPDAEWRRVLNDWHVVRLTLPLRQTCGHELPEWVRERIDGFLVDNELRFARIKETYSRATERLENFGVDHIVLKGFSLWPGYVDHPAHRPQSDIDLYCPQEMVLSARNALFSFGYTSNRSTSSLDRMPGDHLWSLNPPGSWEWNGNHFDPDIPISFELHFRFWDHATNRICPEGLEEFWPRRIIRVLDELSFPALDPVDNFGYTAINILRDLLRTSPSPGQVYSLARFLHHREGDTAFWKHWRTQHSDSLRRLQAISIQLAADWFTCRLSGEVQEEVEKLDPSIKDWLSYFLKSTYSTEFSSRKDGLWLHLPLVESRRDKISLCLQRLAPVPGLFPTGGPEELEPVGNRSVPPPDSVSELKRFGRKSIKYARWCVSRGLYHSTTITVTLSRGLRYQLSRKTLGSQFWTFFAASFCFDFGMTMYFFLFNIYLLNRGFKADFLGLMMSAMNIGSIACTIPAGILIQRAGIRKSLLLCISLLSLASASRALFAPRLAILGLALLCGFLTTIWAVAVSPAIALLTDEKSRPFGFSVVFSSGIGVGILANLAASRLPGVLMRMNPTLAESKGMQVVLLMATAIVALALIPLMKLRLPAPPYGERRVYPRNPFLLRFLPALAIWSVVTGSLSPLANVYFAEYLHTPLERMGTVFSFSKLFQVLGILIAPFIFRKLGVVSGVAYTQLAAALLLGFLAVSSGAIPAAVIYVVFTGFLWMGEPGMFSLLMGSVHPDERAGASALNFLVISLVQAGAVAVTGASITRFGYPAVLGTLAVIALIAAVMFWLLLGNHGLRTEQAHAAIENTGSVLIARARESKQIP